MSDFNNENIQKDTVPAEPVQTVPQAEPEAVPPVQPSYQPPQYTQSYQPPQYMPNTFTPPTGNVNGYQPPSYTQQYQQPYQPQQQQPAPQPYPQPVPYQQPYQAPKTYGQKSRIAAALLAFMAGYFGVHNFYLGNTGKGVAQLLIGTVGAVITCGIGLLATEIWAIVEGIQLLKGTKTVDGHGLPFID